MIKRVGKDNGSSRAIFISIFLLAIVLSVACEPRATETPLDKISVQLKWLHQAQFAGLYAAEANGFYADESIAVSFIPGGRTADLVSSVVEGRADFGITAADSLLVSRSEGLPVIAIATVYRLNPLVYISLPDSGITRPQEFVGHNIGVSANQQVIFDALMAKLGITPDQYKVIREPGLESFYAGDIQVSNAYLVNEVIAAKEDGIDLNIIYPSDYGIHFYSDTVFTTDEIAMSNPDLVTRFLRASLRGWRWAIENPKEASFLTLDYDSELDIDHQVAQMEASIPLVHTGDDQLGWMRSEIWDDMYNILIEQGLLEASYILEDVYTMDFLVEIYGEEP